jgi:hypothetical protein
MSFRTFLGLYEKNRINGETLAILVGKCGEARDEKLPCLI